MGLRRLLLFHFLIFVVCVLIMSACLIFIWPKFLLVVAAIGEAWRE